MSAGRGRNLGQRSGDGVATTKRLFYVDWPLLDRHRDGLVARVDRWVDVQHPGRPTSIDGATMRDTMDVLASQPFRTRPTFNTTPWGGRWGQQQLGFNPGGANTALGYELIAPESGVLVGDVTATVVELPFQLIVASHPGTMLGPAVHEVFGTSFPIRFDYLDTVDGGNLSVHCHPRPAYMKEIFGWSYPQHETYYVMVGGQGRPRLPRPSRRCRRRGVPPASGEGGPRWRAVPDRAIRSGLSRRAAPPLLRTRRDATWQQRRKRRARSQRNAVPLLAAFLRLATTRRRGPAAAGPCAHAFDNLDTERTGARRQVRPRAVPPCPAGGRRLAGGAARVVAGDVLRGPSSGVRPRAEPSRTTPPAAFMSSTSWTVRVWRSSPSAGPGMCWRMPRPWSSPRQWVPTECGTSAQVGSAW